MTQISIMSGIYTDETSDWRGFMPVNKELIMGDNGVAKGYLGQVHGATQQTSGYGRSRGGIERNGACFRVMGSRLLGVTESGATSDYGDVGDDGRLVSLDYSFDRLAIASAGKLWYLIDGATSVVQVTDPDLGAANDVLFIDGRFMTTDGTSLVITELSNPMAVDPLKYGSAETDPDPIYGLCKIRGEVYALGRFTIQNFRDVGGGGFPFTNNPGGFIPRGIVGRKAWSYFHETFAFLGCARRERPSVYIADAGSSRSISTQEVDKLLATLTAEELASVEMEQRNDQNEQRLFMHLPDRSLCYMAQASAAVGEPVWITLRNGVEMDGAYPVRHLVPCFGKWLCASPDGRIGYVDEESAKFWGIDQGWEFRTNFLYNGSRGGIIHKLELVGLPGRVAFGDEAKIFLSTSIDGETFGREFAISAGKFGQRSKRLVWWLNRRFANSVVLRFRGVGNAHISFTRLEADVEALAA